MSCRKESSLPFLKSWLSHVLPHFTDFLMWITINPLPFTTSKLRLLAVFCLRDSSALPLTQLSDSPSPSALYALTFVSSPLHSFFWSLSRWVKFSSAMWLWVFAVLSCLLVALILFLITGKRYKVFSEKCLRPPGPLVTNSNERDARLKKGKRKRKCMQREGSNEAMTVSCSYFTAFFFFDKLYYSSWYSNTFWGKNWQYFLYMSAGS